MATNKRDTVPQQRTREPLVRLLELVETLRGANGCPWDRKQTPTSLSVYLVEEVFELVEAIESGSADSVREELGDVLFHLFFLASMYRESGHFDIQETALSITEKMIRRHPHVFGDVTVKNTEDVRQNWGRIKASEKSDTAEESVLSSVPKKLPALHRAFRISERAVQAGFEWIDMDAVLETAEEEWAEFRNALASADEPSGDEKVKMEFGDLLFTLVNVARHVRIHPEHSLSMATQKFEKRFRRMEIILAGQHRKLNALSPTQMRELWEQCKAEVG